MDTVKKRNMFLAMIFVLVIAILAISVYTIAKGPRNSSVEVVQNDGSGELKVNDLYQGEMTIPYYDISTSSFKPDDFAENKGVISYEGGESYVGINVNSKMGDIDWAKVVESGVDYAMIRVGYRGNDKGKISLDSNFVANITGATEAGLPVGVYFYSKAVTDAEAEEEATFVLEQIKGYSVTYPIAYYWEYDLKEDGTANEDSRTVRCNGEQVTGFINTFCKKIKNTGFTASYYGDKSMCYERLNLELLKDYDLWYAEYRPAPSFYYDFKLWQYTKEGEVPGIAENVPITIALKKYG